MCFHLLWLLSWIQTGDGTVKVAKISREKPQSFYTRRSEKSSGKPQIFKSEGEIKEIRKPEIRAIDSAHIRCPYVLLTPWTTHALGKLKEVWINTKELNWNLNCQPRARICNMTPTKLITPKKSHPHTSEKNNKIQRFLNMKFMMLRT